MTAFACPFIHTPGWAPWETRIGKDYQESHVVCWYGNRYVIADTTHVTLSTALMIAANQLLRGDDRR